MLSSASYRRSKAEDRLNLVFRALADPTRRALLGSLAQGPTKVTDLAEPFKMSLPAVSKHLKVLERARLLVRDVDGRVHRCSLGAEPLREADQWLSRYRPFWEETLDALARYVEQDKNKQDGGR
ncbi:MAG TPA: metalloregulator ArsR/SmtB family transcription factor [Vicinamibacteria bacterium]|jgi:DNA-binding transcriptional ArsR family regulator|nr:metalloregulator ArsR/SmtB family transcription factor [Vicinamibacteria bacterium]